MTANQIVDASRIVRLRELNSELAKTKARLAAAEQELSALNAHFHVALAALDDLRKLGHDERFSVVDGWNAILKNRNVAKLDAATVSQMKRDFLKAKGIGAGERKPESSDGKSCPVREWIVFDGSEENSYCAGGTRVTHTGGTGLHRADRLILDYVHSVKLLDLNPSRICVLTADKDFAKKLRALGATVESGNADNLI